MTAITYIVTGKPVNPARLGTEQTFTIDRLTEFTLPEPTMNRSYASSMDHRSGKGTFISAHETSRIGITIPIDEKPYLDEMIYSLADYQVAEIDATDVNYVGAVREFVMQGTSFPREAKGCTHISCSFDLKFLD